MATVHCSWCAPLVGKSPGWKNVRLKVRVLSSGGGGGENAPQKTVEETGSSSAKSLNVEKELSKAVRKTAGTFAPRSSTAKKNPAVPGTALYTIFEAQGYLSMAFGGLLAFNYVLPSDEPDIWRLMGMWSVWMFTIPSLRARDCSAKEKDALNYLFLAIPLINIVLPFFWKSFAAVWSADVVAFLAMYAWKMDWLKQMKTEDDISTPKEL